MKLHQKKELQKILDDDLKGVRVVKEEFAQRNYANGRNHFVIIELSLGSRIRLLTFRKFLLLNCGSIKNRKRIFGGLYKFTV